MTLCEECGKLPAAIQTETKQLCLVCAMHSADPAAERRVREMGLTETELKRMLKTVGGDDAEDTAPAEREAPVLTDIPGIDVISPAVQPEEKPADSPRFALRYSQPFGDRIILVFTDRQTGVQYITNDDLTGFSPLLDADGRPLI